MTSRHSISTISKHGYCCSRNATHPSTRLIPGAAGRFHRLTTTTRGIQSLRCILCLLLLVLQPLGGNVTDALLFGFRQFAVKVTRRASVRGLFVTPHQREFRFGQFVVVVIVRFGCFGRRWWWPAVWPCVVPLGAAFPRPCVPLPWLWRRLLPGRCVASPSLQRKWPVGCPP